MLELILAYQMPHTNKNIAVQLFNFCIAMKKEGDAKGYFTGLIYGKTNFINWLMIDPHGCSFIDIWHLVCQFFYH
jgi:hypothetical protein